MEAELDDTPTARQVWDALPIEGSANLWGDEIYFEISVRAAQEADARETVDVGTLGYWPVGHAFCIFFGPTPVSGRPGSGDERPRAYSPCNILGRVLGDATRFREVRNGQTVTLSRAE
jgi:hypothetical protein